MSAGRNTIAQSTPRSTDGEGSSRFVSPETNFTIYSPEETRTNGKSAGVARDYAVTPPKYGGSKSYATSTFVGDRTSNINGRALEDPFTGNDALGLDFDRLSVNAIRQSSLTANSRLSANAKEFHPSPPSVIVNPMGYRMDIGRLLSNAPGFSAHEVRGLRGSPAGFSDNPIGTLAADVARFSRNTTGGVACNVPIHRSGNATGVFANNVPGHLSGNGKSRLSANAKEFQPSPSSVNAPGRHSGNVKDALNPSTPPTKAVDRSNNGFRRTPPSRLKVEQPDVETFINYVDAIKTPHGRTESSYDAGANKYTVIKGTMPSHSRSSSGASSCDLGPIGSGRPSSSAAGPVGSRPSSSAAGPVDSRPSSSGSSKTKSSIGDGARFGARYFTTDFRAPKAERLSHFLVVGGFAMDHLDFINNTLVQEPVFHADSGLDYIVKIHDGLGMIYLVFDDLDRAQTAFTKALRVAMRMSTQIINIVEYLDVYEFARANPQHWIAKGFGHGLNSLNLYEGQVQLKIRLLKGPPVRGQFPKWDRLMTLAERTATNFGGKIHKMVAEGLSGVQFSYRIEFKEFSAVTSLLLTIEKDYRGHFMDDSVDVTVDHWYPEDYHPVQIANLPFTSVHGPVNEPYRPHRAMGPIIPVTPVTPIHGSFPPVHADPHNAVDLRKIEWGYDVRTTIMLRNIPNKLTCEDLAWLLNQKCFGLYDFSYLRIDFQNNSNVGYAFINFIDAVYIIDFAKAVASKPWTALGFQSKKQAEISYATCQGRECLIAKFRNSSVMRERPEFRPKLFYSLRDGDRLCGLEEEFPAPDNMAKFRRSMDNATCVGLFPPRHSAHSDDRRIGMHSMYDRGTPHSIAEEGRARAGYHRRNGSYSPQRRTGGYSPHRRNGSNSRDARLRPQLYQDEANTLYE